MISVFDGDNLVKECNSKQDADVFVMQYIKENACANVRVLIKRDSEYLQTTEVEMFVKKLINDVALSKGYDSVESFLNRLHYDGPYKSEAILFAKWMDYCWETAYSNKFKSLSNLTIALPKQPFED